MSTEIPALPPRKVATTSQVENEAMTLTGCPCYSPMALLVHLETFHSDHKHVFKSLIVEKSSSKEDNMDMTTTAPETPVSLAQDDLIETMNIDENLVRIESNKTSRYICQVCHIWLQVEHSMEAAEKCSAPNYLCHHYHSQSLGGYYCCGCQYAIATEFIDPVVSMAVLKRLEATRSKARSFADMMQKKGEQDPTLVSTYTTVLVYIKDLLSGVKRNINSVNPNFLSRIGLSDGR